MTEVILGVPSIQTKCERSFFVDDKTKLVMSEDSERTKAPNNDVTEQVNVRIYGTMCRLFTRHFLFVTLSTNFGGKYNSDSH